MNDRHDHSHGRPATAAAPTISLLRLSALQRLAGAGVILVLLWLAVAATIASPFDPKP